MPAKTEQLSTKHLAAMDRAQEQLARSPKERMEVRRTSELAKVLRLPDFQRAPSLEHVDGIFGGLVESIRRGQEPKLPGCLVCLEEPDGTTILADGNHRLAALRRLLESPEPHDVRIYVQFIQTDGREESERLFEKINKNLPVAALPEGVRLSQVNKIIGEIANRFPCKKKGIAPLFSGSDRVVRPRISTRAFSEHVGRVLAAGIPEAGFVDRIVACNERLQGKTAAFFRDAAKNDSLAMVDKFLATADLFGCRLGLVFYGDYRRLYDEFGLVPTGRPLYNRMPREAVSAALRLVVWNKHCGEDARHAECPFCKSRISFENFVCAHDTAHADGGKADAGNLFPCCATCNLSMGRQNFEEFRARIRGAAG